MNALLRNGERVAAPNAGGTNGPGSGGLLSRLRKDTSGGEGDKSNRASAPLLQGVNVEKYPRPDLGKWALYKPEPGQAKLFSVVTLENEKSNSAVSNGASQGVKREFPATSGNGPSSSSSSSVIMVPEQIADFMAALPKKELYNGTLSVVVDNM